MLPVPALPGIARAARILFADSRRQLFRLCFNLELCFVQFLIGPPGLNELVMLSPFNNLSVPDHQNLICRQNSGQTMGDQNARPAFNQRIDRLLNQIFRNRIQCGCCLVKDQLRRVRAMEIRCFSPPESFSPRLPTMVSSPSG